MALIRRFIVNRDGDLTLIPLPDIDRDEYLKVQTSTQEMLPYEYFVSDKFGAPTTLRLPHTYSLTRALFHYRIVSRVKGEPSYAPFYESTHQSSGLDVTAGIMRHFWQTAHARSQAAVILLVPDIKVLKLVGAGQPESFAPLRSILQDTGIPVPEVSHKMTTYLDGKDPCVLYVRCGGRSQFNEEGYRVLAGIDRGWSVENEFRMQLALNHTMFDPQVDCKN